MKNPFPREEYLTARVKSMLKAEQRRLLKRPPHSADGGGGFDLMSPFKNHFSMGGGLGFGDSGPVVVDTSPSASGALLVLATSSVRVRTPTSR